MPLHFLLKIEDLCPRLKRLVIALSRGKKAFEQHPLV